VAKGWRALMAGRIWFVLVRLAARELARVL